ncbi:MAG: transporter substrate-binding domain-containing protein [Bacteroidia bacterium]|nr:transporter substrate-binding domain-containing protein [Bacteroidia bacterium]
MEVFFTSCSKNPVTSYNNNNTVSFDLDSIRARGRLIAVTDFNSTNYFIYRGEPMGFHYELLSAFADHLGVDLEMIKENHLEEAFDLLNTGKADLLAISLTINSTRRNEILFSTPVYETRQILVQRKPRQWRYMTTDELNSILIRNQLDLAGKTVFVQKGSSHSERLISLAAEIGDSISIIEVPNEAEQLIRNVARGDIQYAVADENVAMVNATYYPDIDINTPVSFPQNIGWGLRKKNTEMLSAELNKWLTAYKKTNSYAFLYAKYFKNERSRRIIKSDYYALSTGKISQWDDLIKSASTEIDWDWRLLASLIYQESRFDPDVKSWAGAYGLMQIMPVTSKSLGIDITSTPSNNIKAGTIYLDQLHSIFNPRIKDEKERIKFILASYNAGPGHVLDAMRLADKYGMNPQVWDNVAVWLQKKSEPRYYNDTVVKNGYFRGTESVNFVTEILDRFEHYKNFVPEQISQNYK